MRRSNVIFNADSHTYFLGDRQLQGVTGILNRNLFADKYSDVPDSILQKAAKRGSEIHEACQMADMFGVINLPEAQDYTDLCKEYNIKPIENEYLVSDEENYATMIDMVDSHYNLYDIKTTSVLDEEYLSWQLSINAYLFELQNPDLNAGYLFGIWLRNGKAVLKQVRKQPKEAILHLLFCDSNGIPFTQDKPASVEETLQKLSDLEQLIIVQKAEIEAIEKQQENLKQFLMQQMAENGVKKWETDNIIVTYIAPSFRCSIDSKKLKEEMPEIFNKYQKESEVKSSIKIKIK